MSLNREISPQVKLTLFLGRFPVYFGLLFLCFSLPIITLLLGNIDFTPPGAFHDAAKTTAIIDGIEDTRSQENNNRIRAYSYRFTDNSGQEQAGVSYSSFSTLVAGSQAEVLYKQNDPSVSRLTDMRRKPFGPGISVLVILPLVGLVFAGYGISKYPSLVEVLRKGEPGTACFVGKQPTMARVNGKTLYAIQYEFRGSKSSKRHYFTVHSTNKELLSNTDSERFALYSEDRGLTVLLEALPGNPTLSQEERMEGHVNGITVFTTALLFLFPFVEAAILASIL